MERARDFYGTVLGWQVAPGRPEFGGYATASAGGLAVAGIGPIMGEQVSAWTLSFASDDADETAAAIWAAGGETLSGVHDVGDLGRLVIARDPTGAAFGVWQGGSMPGFASTGTPGAFTWCDLRSPEPQRARDFYASVFAFGYAPEPMAGPDYATFGSVLPGDDHPGRPLGGIGPMMGAAGGTPAHWLVYFTVTSADTAARQAAARGGTSVSPPFDTPFGRMAPLIDPFGAPLWVVQPLG